MNIDNAIHQAKLNAEYAERMAARVPRTMHTHSYVVSCVRCGVLTAWAWTEGDKTDQSASLNGLFKLLSKHQNVKYGHLLRFKHDVRPVVVLE